MKKFVNVTTVGSVLVAAFIAWMVKMGVSMARTKIGR